MAALVLPVGDAAAQRNAFIKDITDLATALEGTYGDEGASVGPAIDRMSASLAQWDREIEAAAATARATSPDAQSADRHIELARVYADRGRFADALAELEAADVRPRADLLVLRGLVLRASGKPAEAMEAFRAAQAVQPNDPVLAYYGFHEASANGDTREAGIYSRSLVAAYPGLMTSARGKQTPFAHIALFQSAAAGPPVVPLGAYSQAFRQIARHEYEKAIEEFRKASASDPLNASGASKSILNAVAALKRGRFDEARAQIDQDKTLASSSEAHRVLGLIYWAGSEYDKSMTELREAIRLAPRNERARLALSRVLSTAGRDAEAADALEETLRALPDSALAHWSLASLCERLNRFADARAEYEQAAAAAIAGQAQLYGSIGTHASGAADVAGTISGFGRAVSANPNDGPMHRYLAEALMQQDRPDEAMVEFIAAALIDARDAEAHAGVGRVHLNAGRATEAASALKRATELAPANPEARYALATALAQLGQTSEAAQHFARVEQQQRDIISDRRRTMSFDVLKEEATLRVGEGKLSLAIELYEKALSIRSDPDVYSRLADLYARVGRASDAARARAMFEKARQSGEPGTAR